MYSRILPAIGLCAVLLAACGRSDSLVPPPFGMTITSPAFSEGTSIPARYTCDGDSISPPLAFGSIPDGTRSLVLMVDDPDAPSGDFVHWLVYDIGPTTSTVEEGMVPDGGKEGRTSAGEQQYVGPCPPSGSHRYVFSLYALDSVLSFESVPAKDDVVRAMTGHALAEARLVGTYSRNQ